MLKFHKGQSLGNDFVFIEIDDLPNAKVKQLADRKYGIGCDQLLLYSVISNGEIRVKIYNQDGSEAGNCGNGLRTLAQLLQRDITCIIWDKKYRLFYSNEHIEQEVGNATFREYFDPMLGKGFEVDIGNRHLIWQRLDISDAKIMELSNEANVSIFHYQTPDTVKLQVFEKGSGFTNACGSGAGAVMAILPEEKIIISQAGGNLLLWRNGKTIFARGKAEIIYHGFVA